MASLSILGRCWVTHADEQLSNVHLLDAGNKICQSIIIHIDIKRGCGNKVQQAVRTRKSATASKLLKKNMWKKKCGLRERSAQWVRGIKGALNMFVLYHCHTSTMKYRYISNSISNIIMFSIFCNNFLINFYSMLDDTSIYSIHLSNYLQMSSIIQTYSCSCTQ